MTRRDRYDLWALGAAFLAAGLAAIYAADGDPFELGLVVFDSLASVRFMLLAERQR